MQPKEPATQDNQPQVFDLNLPDTTLSGMISRRASESKAHWNKEYDLDKVREKNLKLYNSEDVKKKMRDERYQDVFSDNKHFTSIRTILPFVMSKLSQPEIVPASSKDLNMQFSQDFEKILVEEAEEQNGTAKVKLAIQDLLKGQRIGILKWVYNPGKQKLCLEYVKPTSVVIGKRSKLFEELDFLQETQTRSIGQLVKDFPDKKDELFKLYEIQRGMPSQLEKEVEITENWMFVEEEEENKLAVIFKAGESLVLGKMVDPNWSGDDNNLIDEHMMPYVFFNLLNDGSGYIDDTSFIEMAEFNQKNYDKRGSTIAENANYAGIGVPVFGKGAIKAETAAKVKFNPTQRIMLDVEDVGKSFTTWKADSMPQYVFEDKQESKDSVLDIWGTNQVQSGENSDNKTLGQDVLLRNQAEGRQQELIAAIDSAMQRFYKLEAQMIYRYYDEDQYYNFLGEDGSFEHIILTQKRLAENLNIKIKIKAGSSLPVDRSQKFAQALELAKLNRIGTLRLYKELGIEDPEQAYQEYLKEQLAPIEAMAEAATTVDSREAMEDLLLVIAGKKPLERDDISEDYLMYLQNYLETQQFDQLKVDEQKRVVQYVAEVIAQAQRKLLKLMAQEPMPAAPGQPVDPNAPQPTANGAPTPDVTQPQPAPTAGQVPVQ
jgi:hypothetical protein